MAFIRGPYMRHFEYLTEADEQRLFHLPPQPFTTDDDPGVLALASARRSTARPPARRWRNDIARQRGRRRDEHGGVPRGRDRRRRRRRRRAQRGRSSCASYAAQPEPDGPLIFVRVRAPEQIAAVVDGLGERPARPDRLRPARSSPTQTGPRSSTRSPSRAPSGPAGCYAMPVLESPEVVYAETRAGALVGVRQLLAKHRDTSSPCASAPPTCPASTACAATGT